MYKKIISLMLMFTIIISSTLPAVASENFNANSIKVLKQTKNDQGEIIEEISQINGNTYYFEKNKNYNISITKLNNGNISISKMDNDNPGIVYTKTIPAAKSLKKGVCSSNHTLNLIYNVKENILNNKIKLDNIQKFTQTTTFNSLKSSSSSVPDKIADALAEREGRDYVNKFLGSKNSNHVYAMLIEDKTYFMAKHTSWIINAGTAVSIVTSLMGIPASLIGKIFLVFATATGVLSIVNDCVGNHYDANVNSNKKVKIKNEIHYRAGRTAYYDAYVGDLRASLVHKRDNEDYDYQDNEALLRKGIQNYLDFSD